MALEGADVGWTPGAYSSNPNARRVNQSLLKVAF